jgi:CubicO group peptidase (beta-lactamase class C family)
MKLTVFEQNLTQKIKEAIVDVTPGLYIRAYQNGRLMCDISVGDVYPYYDLASLTKIIFTVQMMMKFFDEGKWNLQTKVQDVLSSFPHENILIKDLLTHTSGLMWWKPFYKEINLMQAPQQKLEQLFQLACAVPLEETDRAVYSDLNFIVLGRLLQTFANKELYEVWTDCKNLFYENSNFDFHLGQQPQHETKLYAPTEECSWRKKLIQGEVHDENTWAVGGVSAQAGLFGSVDDLANYMLLLRSQIHGIARYSIKQKTAKLFAQRAIPVETGDWALGYMLPTEGVASCGPYFSLDSIGHLGFTGTSVWYDMKNDLLVGILSNRTLYGRDLDGFKKLRPQLHNWIFEGIKRN